MIDLIQTTTIVVIIALVWLHLIRDHGKGGNGDNYAVQTI